MIPEKSDKSRKELNLNLDKNKLKSAPLKTPKLPSAFGNDLPLENSKVELDNHNKSNEIIPTFKMSNQDYIDYCESVYKNLVKEHSPAEYWLVTETLRIVSTIEKKGYKDVRGKEEKIFKFLYSKVESMEVFPQKMSDYEAYKYIDYLYPKTAVFDTKKNLALCSSSMVMDTMFSYMVSKNIPTQEDLNNPNNFKIIKKFNSDKINEIHINFYMGIIEEVKHKYGIDNYNLISLLMCYWYHYKNYSNEAKLTGKEILELIDSMNRVKWDKENSLTVRTNINESLEYLYTLIKSLKNISVFFNPDKLENTDNLKIKEDSLIYASIETQFKNKKLTDLTITFKPGTWFDFFDDKVNGLKQFGFIHRQAFIGNELQSAFLHFLSLGLSKHQNGEYKIKTILEAIGLKNDLDKCLIEKNKNIELALFKKFNCLLNYIITINNPYQWKFKTQNPPEWLLGKNRKPKGWFSNSWLNTVIIFSHPDISQWNSNKRNNNKPEKLLTPKPKYIVEDVLIALDNHKSNKSVSKNKLANYIGKNRTWLINRLNPKSKYYGKDLTPKIIEECIKGIQLLAKDNNK